MKKRARWDRLIVCGVERIEMGRSAKRTCVLIVGLLLQHSNVLWGQSAMLEEFKTAAHQCAEAKTAQECQAALPACETVYQMLSSRAANPEMREATARALGKWAQCESKLGRYVAAESHRRTQLALLVDLYGSDHQDVAISLGKLAETLAEQRRYADAETFYRRALAISQKLLSPAHPHIEFILLQLVHVSSAQRNYAETELLLRQIRALREKRQGSEDEDAARDLDHLAIMVAAQGRYAEAISLLEKALTIREKLLGLDHPDHARSFQFAAGLLAGQKRYAEAEALLQKALAVLRRRSGPSDPDVNSAMAFLAVVLSRQGKNDEAEVLLQVALASSQSHQGRKGPEALRNLECLALVRISQGNYFAAEELLREIIDHQRHQSDLERSKSTVALNTLAALLLTQGQKLKALPVLHDAAVIHEVQIRSTVSEPRMQALLDDLREEEEVIYSLLLAPRLPRVEDLALSTALSRKGRIAEAGAIANQFLRRSLGNPEIAQQYGEWQSLRQQHEALLYTGPGQLSDVDYRKRLQETKLQAESLEAQLASALPEMKNLQPPKLDQIVAKVAVRLKPGSVLVEVVLTHPYQGIASTDGKEWGEPHFIAMLLFPDQHIETLDLGEAATIDQLCRALLAALSSRASNPIPSAQALYRQLMQPLLTRLGGVRELFLSLDGMLNLIPFDALHDGTAYLLGRYRIHYLTSGRDLLREPSQRKADAPLVLANPDFGMAEEGQQKGASLTLYQRLAGLPVLPGTQREADQIASLLGVKPQTQRAAREEAIRATHAPRILHIATHGLFLPDVELPAPVDWNNGLRSIRLLDRERTKNVGVADVNRLPGYLGAMNRSALVLAGVAQGDRAPGTAQDGLLTAEEARSLDLDGTQLVVLSACETGQGVLSAGQGIYGLRRAFLVAGAETLVTSLWRVHDEATGELMGMYYRKLLDTKQPGDRLGAMVDAMQELRSKPGRSHPYYWAPFLVIGQAGPLRPPAANRP